MAMPMFWHRQRAPTRANKLARKEDGIDLLVMPSSLNDKLFALVGAQRQLVTRFGKTA